MELRHFAMALIGISLVILSTCYLCYRRWMKRISGELLRIEFNRDDQEMSSAYATGTFSWSQYLELDEAWLHEHKLCSFPQYFSQLCLKGVSSGFGKRQMM